MCAAAKGNEYARKYTPEMIKKLCSDLLAFAERDQSVHFVEFARENGKTQTWLNRMAEDYPEFEEAYKDAKEILAAKLVRTSIYGHPTNPNFNGSHAMSWMGVYSTTWKNYKKYLAEISKEQPSIENNKSAFNEWKEKELNASSK